MATNPTAPVVAHYKSDLAKGLDASDKTAISVALRNMTVAAWLASVTKASSKAESIATGVQAKGLNLGAPADAGPAWAATADIPSDALPDDLAIRLSDLDDYAQNLADGESDLDPEDQADLIARSSTLLIAGLASQAAFRAGGVDQWNLELDGPDPCPECEEAEANGPYDVGDGPDLPIHDRCECEAAPVTDSSSSSDSSDDDSESDDSASRSGDPQGAHMTETRKTLKAADLDKLEDDDFAYIDSKGDKHLPINDEEHVRAALARFSQTEFEDGAAKKAAAKKILAAAKKFDIEVGDDTPAAQAARSDEEESEDRADCPTCKGKGTIMNGHRKCPDCSGSGEQKSATIVRRKPRATRELQPGPEFRMVNMGLELRAGKATDDGLIPVEGTVIRYGAQYDVTDMFGTFRETIHAGACTDLLKSPDLDVRFLFNHGDWPLARTGAAAGLTCTEDADGLHIRALIDPRMSSANDLVVAMERGTITQMSVGMQVDPDGDLWSGEDDRGLPDIRNITKLAKVFDVSAVTYPASPTTSIELAQRMWAAVPVESRERTRQLWSLAREGRKGTISQSESDTLMHAIEDLYTVDAAEAPEARTDVCTDIRTLTPGDGAVIARMEQDGDVFEILTTDDGYTVRAGASRDSFNRMLNDLQDLIAEARNEPTLQDAAVLSAIAKAHQATAGAIAEQAADPDNNTDPVDKKVMGALQDAHKALSTALGHQASDGVPDADCGDDGTQGGDNGMSEGDNADGSGTRAKLIELDLEMAQRRRPILI